jgi:uncharacterized protein YjbI with pentapeptide repeats
VKAGSGTSWLVGITLLALVAGLIIYSYTDWPGARYFGIADKTFWDYLELLIVPATLAFGVYWLNRTQEERQQEADRFQQQLQLGHNQMQQNRGLEVVTQQQQDAALRSYLDQMSQLMLQEGLTNQEPGSEGVGENSLALARARTLPVLPTLNANRKRSVLQFLYEAGLIDKEHPIVDLTGADLRGSALEGASLSDADLSDAYLSDAYLSGSDLRGADLLRADLINADLRGAKMSWTKLSGALLRGSDLGGAQLYEAVLYEAVLEGADLNGTVLSRANLFGADLREATLSGAVLGGADLRGATGVTTEQLSTARFLGGATMPDGPTLTGDYHPDGPTFEEWLKSKDRESGGENSGPS